MKSKILTITLIVSFAIFLLGSTFLDSEGTCVPYIVCGVGAVGLYASLIANKLIH